MKFIDTIADVAWIADNLKNDGLSWKEITNKINKEYGKNYDKENIRKAWRRHVKQEFKKVKAGISNNNVEEIGHNNVKEITSRGVHIKTLNDLLEICDINLNEWKIDRHVVNKWDQHSVSAGFVEMFQVKAWLSKIIPDKTLFPVVQPINIESIGEIKYTKNDSKIKCAFIIPDSQIGFKRDIHTGKLSPFHDRLALDISVQIANKISPDRIILLGDMLDLPDWSDKFLRSPEMYWTTQPAVIELAWWISKLRLACPNAKIDYLAGNHEVRMDKQIINHLIAAYDLRPADNLGTPAALSIENLVGLKSLDVTYHNKYPGASVWLNKNLRCRHGDIARKGGGSTSKIILRDTFVSEIVGHVHRKELSCKTVVTSDGEKTYTVFSPGTISKIDGMVPSNTADEDWQQGLGVVYYEEGDGDFQIIPISINNGKSICNGEKIIGIDRGAQLKKETGWLYF